MSNTRDEQQKDQQTGQQDKHGSQHSGQGSQQDKHGSQDTGPGGKNPSR